MRVLKTLGLVEEYGEGIERMYREMESRLLEPPVFTATDSSVTVTLYSRSVIDVEDQLWLQALAGVHATADERRLLLEVRQAGVGTTPRQLREAMPGVDIQRLLAGARAKGLLTRVGTRGGSRYVLSDLIVRIAGGADKTGSQVLLDEIRRRGSLSHHGGRQGSRGFRCYRAQNAQETRTGGAGACRGQIRGRDGTFFVRTMSRSRAASGRWCDEAARCRPR